MLGWLLGAGSGLCKVWAISRQRSFTLNAANAGREPNLLIQEPHGIRREGQDAGFGRSAIERLGQFDFGYGNPVKAHRRQWQVLPVDAHRTWQGDDLDHFVFFERNANVEDH